MVTIRYWGVLDGVSMTKTSDHPSALMSTAPVGDGSHPPRQGNGDQTSASPSPSVSAAATDDPS
ncbi:MAG TPA: hypothetical protein VLB31_04325, partial [Actinomycetota bacterium]|nr:hypothetical protein [Actinomycetota bacterium]